MCAVAKAIIEWVTVRDWSAGAIKGIAHEICPILHKTARAKAATKGGVRVVDAGVHNADAEALAGKSLGAELVDLRQDMRRPGVGRVGLALILGGGTILTRPCDVQLGHGDQWHRPQLLNLGQCGYLVGCLVMWAIHLEGHAFEDLGLKFDALGDTRNACF